MSVAAMETSVPLGVTPQVAGLAQPRESSSPELNCVRGLPVRTVKPLMSVELLPYRIIPGDT